MTSTHYPKNLTHYCAEEVIPSKFCTILKSFYESYRQAIEQAKGSKEEMDQLFHQFVELIVEQQREPYSFGLFHQSIRKPFDYYAFGLNFMRPLILFNQSKVFRLELVNQMCEQLARGDNVILLANHQTEPDPQVIALLLEKTHPKFAEDMIFVAGHRVITDPLAIPISKGCNLLCIYSKKHIANPPEEKPSKMAHNQRTMKKMAELLSEGGKCIYVAPSGGRDRPNAQGKLEVAPFDPQNIELFWLMAKQADCPTHFYPLALATYHMLPPPNSVEKEVGERRQARCSPVHLAFGDEIDMEHFPGSEGLDKKEKRNKRADYIWNLVRKDYHMISDESQLKNATVE
jgi:glycerol-3-phosphate O-acyltransferase